MKCGWGGGRHEQARGRRRRRRSNDGEPGSFFILVYSKCGKQDLNPINDRKMALPKRYTENSWKKNQDFLPPAGRF
jgi:hypothetical protein